MIFIIPILDVLKSRFSLSDLKLISISLLSTRFKVTQCSFVTATWHLYHMLGASSVGGKIILEIRYENKCMRGHGMKRQG